MVLPRKFLRAIACFLSSPTTALFLRNSNAHHKKSLLKGVFEKKNTALIKKSTKMPEIDKYLAKPELIKTMAASCISKVIDMCSNVKIDRNPAGLGADQKMNPDGTKAIHDECYTLRPTWDEGTGFGSRTNEENEEVATYRGEDVSADNKFKTNPVNPNESHYHHQSRCGGLNCFNQCVAYLFAVSTAFTGAFVPPTDGPVYTEDGMSVVTMTGGFTYETVGDDTRGTGADIGDLPADCAGILTAKKYDEGTQAWIDDPSNALSPEEQTQITSTVVLGIKTQYVEGGCTDYAHTEIPSA